MIRNQKVSGSATVLMLLGCIIFLHATSSAQAGRVEYGLTVSPTLGWAGGPDEEVDVRGLAFGIRYGVVVDYILDEEGQVAIASGLNMHHTASKFESPSDEYKIATTLIEIPASLKMSTRINDGKSYFGQFGLLFGLPLNNTVKDGPDANGDVDHVQIALRFGLGTQIEMDDQGIELSLGLFYDNGFTNVYQVEGDEFRMKHLSLGAAVFF